MELNVGDVVQLKSGGPKMTVEKVDRGSGYFYVDCVWFDYDATTVRKHRFYSLELFVTGTNVRNDGNW